jgi:hypothetical protein
MDIERSNSHAGTGPRPTAAMTHIAIQALDGKMVQWLEKVTDDQYAGRS